ncbi:MAG TPA: TIR domain-containing protein, partial [Candidatus Bathyarchaeia archaeon]|nr:TIR domain-containing protein [Candidatus Bathyarchaeia archaeon]
SIPDSAQWRREIFDAIDAADNFVFLVSPDSLGSAMCKQEVARAVSKGKRIITILYHQVERKELFPGLGEIQWIVYPELGFRRTLQKLKAALNADLEWERKRTQLGLRAMQWEMNHGESGYLLHGQELAEAVGWLEKAASIQSTQPTRLHEKYIRASEAWETSEIRRLTRLTKEKERQRRAAERSRRVAVARELVASSVQSLEEDPERSILLAMHAVGATQKRDGRVIPEAEAALHEAIERSHVRVAIRQPKTAFSCVAWSPDGGRIATGSDQDRVEVWDAKLGKRVIALNGHRGGTTGVAWSPDGLRLASSGRDQRARVWEVDTGRAQLTLRHDSVVYCIAWSSDGLRIATGSKDARLWNAKTGKLMRRLRAHKRVDGVAWSNGSRYLATVGAQDDTAKIWEAATGKLLNTYVNDTLGVNSVAWSPGDGYLLLSGGAFVNYDSTNVAKVWEVTSKKRKKVVRTLAAQGSYLTDASWSPDGERLATATHFGQVEIWDPKLGTATMQLRGHERRVEQVAWSPASDCVATASADGSVQIWREKMEGELPMLRGHKEKITTVAWSPDSQRLATGGWDDMVKIWDAATGEEQITLGGHEGVVRAVAWSPDGLRLASAAWANDDNHVAKVWDVKTGEVVATLKGHSDLLNNIAWSANGAWLATASRDKTARIWEAATGKEVTTMRGHKDFVHAIGWSADSKMLATGSLDGTVRVWEAGSGKQMFVLARGKARIAVVAWSPNGRKLAAGDLEGRARVWDVAWRGKPRVFAGHRDYVTTLAWSPDSKYLAISGGGEMAQGVLSGQRDVETRVRVFDVTTGEERVTFSDHRDVVTCVAWSPDGKRLAAGGVDRTVRQYAMDIELLMQVARSRVTRNLTPEECRKYLHREDVPAMP